MVSRPRWQWLVFGALSMIVVWLPLAYAAAAFVEHLRAGLPERLSALPDAKVDEIALAVFVAPPLSLVVAGVASGYLLGRWGLPTGRIDAALAATVVVLVGVALTWARSSVMWSAVVSLLLAVPASLLGASLGRRRRGL